MFLTLFDLNIKLWASKTCDIIKYDDYPGLFARLTSQASAAIILLRRNSFSIHPAYQLGILSRTICFSTINSFIKRLIPPYMIDDCAITFPETNEVILLNQVERNSSELKKMLKHVALLPSGIVHVLVDGSLSGKYIQYDFI